MPPIDVNSWEYNAQELINGLPAIREQIKDNEQRITKLEQVHLIQSTASKTRKAIGGAGWSLLGMALPYLLKYVFHINPLP